MLPDVISFLFLFILCGNYNAATANGTDIKSVMINIASILLFFLAFAVIFYREQTMLWIGIVAGVYAIAFLLPPVGWKRPHPYSDYPENRTRGTQPKDD